MANDTIWTDLLNWLSDTAITPTRLNEILGKDGSDVYGNLGFLNNALALGPPGGRLTLTSGTPIPIGDQLAKTTVYYTPYLHSIIGIYESTDDIWKTFQFAEISIAVPATTTTPFDIFIYDNAGTLTLQVVDWTDDDNRATALVEQDGALVKSGDTEKRYLGTGRTTGVSGQCEDSFAKRFVWNYYNRTSRTLSKGVSASHTYSTATFRPWNNDTANRIELIVGVAEQFMNLHIAGDIDPSADGVIGILAYGQNTTSASSSNTRVENGNAQIIHAGVSNLAAFAEGHSFFQMLEWASGASIQFVVMNILGFWRA